MMSDVTISVDENEENHFEKMNQNSFLQLKKILSSPKFTQKHKNKSFYGILPFHIFCLSKKAENYYSVSGSASNPTCSERCAVISAFIAPLLLIGSPIPVWASLIIRSTSLSVIWENPFRVKSRSDSGLIRRGEASTTRDRGSSSIRFLFLVSDPIDIFLVCCWKKDSRKRSFHTWDDLFWSFKVLKKIESSKIIHLFSL